VHPGLYCKTAEIRILPILRTKDAHVSSISSHLAEYSIDTDGVHMFIKGISDEN